MYCLISLFKIGQIIAWIIWAGISFFSFLFQECAARGEDYEKVKLLEISAEDAERWERKKRRKNPDLGFSGKTHLYFIEWACEVSVAFSVSGFKKGYTPSWNILQEAYSQEKYRHIS